MGFFSWDCKKCKHPLLSTYAATAINQWMMQGVAILSSGKKVEGEYDGYGRLDGEAINEELVWNDDDKATNNPDCFHYRCWEVSGKPTKYKGGSKMSEDQGYFFLKGVHDVPLPELPKKK